MLQKREQAPKYGSNEEEEKKHTHLKGGCVNYSLDLNMIWKQRNPLLL
jgi:hypothetical protein